jgi:hypothetical protein
MTEPTNHSEEARLRAQIEAAYNGLDGLAAGSARHDFIQKHMERVVEPGEQLVERLGKEEGIALRVAAMATSAAPSTEEAAPS